MYGRNNCIVRLSLFTYNKGIFEELRRNCEYEEAAEY